MLGRRHDFLAAHIRQLIDLFAEFGRIGIGRNEITSTFCASLLFVSSDTGTRPAATGATSGTGPAE